MSHTEAPAEGYPVRIAVRRVDGPLALTFRDGSTHTFAVEDGHVEATTRARATMLLEHGGTLAAPTDTPPTGSGPTLRKSRGNT